MKQLLEDVDGSAVRRAFDADGVFTLAVDGETVTLAPDEVEIRAEQHDDLTLAQDGPHAVALDLTLDDELRAEGLARELIRALNDLRKTTGFALADRINIKLQAPERIAEAAKKHRDWIMAEALATDLEIHETEPSSTEANTTVDAEPVKAELQKA